MIFRLFGYTAGSLLLVGTSIVGSTLAANADPEYDLIMPTPYSSLCLVEETVCQTDNADLTFHPMTTTNRALEPVDIDVVRPVMFQRYGPGAFTVRQRPLVETGTAETDIVFEEGKAGIPPDFDGMTFCDDKVGGLGSYRCDQQYVRIRGHGMYTAGLTCHEAGHAVGIVHPNNAYPVVPSGLRPLLLGCSPATVSEYASISSLERENINYVY